MVNEFPTSIGFARYSRSHFAVEQLPIASVSLLSHAATSVATRFASVCGIKKFGSFNHLTRSSIPLFKFFVVVPKSLKFQKPSDRDLANEASPDPIYHHLIRHFIDQPSEGFALPTQLPLQKVPRTINRGLFCQFSLLFYFDWPACVQELRLSDFPPV